MMKLINDPKKSSVLIESRLLKEEEEERELNVFVPLTIQIAALTILTDTAATSSSSRATAFVLCRAHVCRSVIVCQTRTRRSFSSSA